MLNERSKQIRRDVIKLSKQYGGYHWGGSFSCIEILIALYDHILTKDDIFILSKGHSCWGYYVLLREKGFNPKIEGHPHLDIHNGIYATTGSLGHGLPFAIGLALSKKIKKELGTIYVLLGDGECQEGTTWESLLILKKLQLDNIKVIIDWNGFQGSGSISDIVNLHAAELDDVISNLGFDVIHIDGHNIDSIVESIRRRYDFIISLTTKGKGVSFMEDKAEWHSKWLTDGLEKVAMEELK